MNKLILFGAIAFVVGAGAGTGLGVQNAAKKAKAVAEAAAADSLAAKAAADSLAKLAHEGPGAAEPAVHGAPSHNGGHAAAPVQAEPAAVTTHAPELHAAPPAPAPARARTDEPADYAQVSRILVNMKPKDAAVILGHLSDDHVEGILRSVGVRQAAALLTALPPERAAVMSRRLIERAPGGER